MVIETPIDVQHRPSAPKLTLPDLMAERPETRNEEYCDTDDQTTGSRARDTAVSQSPTDASFGLSLPAKFRQIGKSTYSDGLCTRLTATDAFIETDQLLPIRSLVILEIEGNANGLRGTIRCSAQIIASRSPVGDASRPAGMDVRFINLKATSRQMIDKLSKVGKEEVSAAVPQIDSPVAASSAESEVQPDNQSDEIDRASSVTGTTVEAVGQEPSEGLRGGSHDTDASTADVRGSESERNLDAANSAAHRTQSVNSRDVVEESPSSPGTVSAPSGDAVWRAQRLTELVLESYRTTDEQTASVVCSDPPTPKAAMSDSPTAVHRSSSHTRAGRLGALLARFLRPRAAPEVSGNSTRQPKEPVPIRESLRAVSRAADVRREGLETEQLAPGDPTHLQELPANADPVESPNNGASSQSPGAKAQPVQSNLQSSDPEPQVLKGPEQVPDQIESNVSGSKPVVVADVRQEHVRNVANRPEATGSSVTARDSTVPHSAARSTPIYDVSGSSGVFQTKGGSVEAPRWTPTQERDFWIPTAPSLTSANQNHYTRSSQVSSDRTWQTVESTPPAESKVTQRAATRPYYSALNRGQRPTQATPSPAALFVVFALAAILAWAETSGHYGELALKSAAKSFGLDLKLTGDEPASDSVAGDVPIASDEGLATSGDEKDDPISEVTDSQTAQIKKRVRKKARSLSSRKKRTEPRENVAATTESLVRAARRALDTGDAKRARELANSAVKQSPSQAEGYIVLAGALDALHKREEMSEVLRSCVSHANDSLVSACKSLVR